MTLVQNSTDVPPLRDSSCVVCVYRRRDCGICELGFTAPEISGMLLTALTVNGNIRLWCLRHVNKERPKTSPTDSAQLSRPVGDKGRDNLQCRRHVCDKCSHMSEGIAGNNGDLVAGTLQARRRYVAGMSAAYVN